MRTGSAPLAFLQLALVLGCSRAATIHTRDGGIHRGEILRNDGQNVHIANERGRVETLDLREVTDVSHPGKAPMIIGAVFVATGVVAFFGIRNQECAPEQREQDRCMTEETKRTLSWYVAGLSAVPGAGLAAYGLETYASSHDRLWDVRPSPRAAPSPVQRGKPRASHASGEIH